MALDNLDILSAKELKSVATDMKIEFAKNASAKEMRELIRSNQNTPVVTETPKETIDEGETLEETPKVIEEDTPVVTETPRANGEYLVKQNIKRSGRWYTKGDTIKLDDEEAKNLLSDGTIE